MYHITTIHVSNVLFIQEKHASGRIASGILYQRGKWLEADLNFSDGDELAGTLAGTMRVRKATTEGVDDVHETQLISNCRPAHASSAWGPDVIAWRDPANANASALEGTWNRSRTSAAADESGVTLGGHGFCTH